MNLRMEIHQYLEYCQYRKELNGNTLKAYRIDLGQYADYIKDAILSKAKIEEYITILHKHFKQKTVKRKLASIKAFYQYLFEEEILTGANPFHKIKVAFKETESLPRIIPRKDIEALLTYMHCQSKEMDASAVIFRDLSIVEMFFATGVRVYELSHLRLENIDLDSGIIKIMGKGGRERYVQIGNDDVLKIMKIYYKANEGQIQKSGFFFINRLGERFTEQSIRNMIKKYTCAAGIKLHITPHMFRHSVATYLLEEGVDIMYIQKLLGHCSIKTTQIYLYIASEKQMEILRTMHPRNHMNISTAA